MSTYIFQGVAPTTPLLHIWFKTYALNLALGMILVLYYNKTPCSFWGRSPLYSDPPGSAPGCLSVAATNSLQDFSSGATRQRNTLCMYTEGLIIAKSIAFFLLCC